MQLNIATARDTQTYNVVLYIDFATVSVSVGLILTARCAITIFEFNQLRSPAIFTTVYNFTVDVPKPLVKMFRTVNYMIHRDVPT